MAHEPGKDYADEYGELANLYRYCQHLHEGGELVASFECGEHEGNFEGGGYQAVARRTALELIREGKTHVVIEFGLIGFNPEDPEFEKYAELRAAHYGHLGVYRSDDMVIRRGTVYEVGFGMSTLHTWFEDEDFPNGGVCSVCRRAFPPGPPYFLARMADELICSSCINLYRLDVWDPFPPERVDWLRAHGILRNEVYR